MKRLCLLLMIFCTASINAQAQDEIVITAAPYTPPPTYGYQSQPGSTIFNYDYKAVAIAQAKTACANHATSQKAACDAKKDKFFNEHIEACDKMGTNGTLGMIGGAGLGAIGTIVALASGPIGWVVLFVGGGVVVAGGGALAQQEGNYGCRDDANNNKETNTQACKNYEAKIKAEICAKIY